MTQDEAGAQIESAINAYGPSAAVMIERILDQVRSEIGQEAVNALIEDHDLELRYNITPGDADFGGG
jgi:hypothetical protein